MKPVKNINRREFISMAAATAAAITIVPRHVLGGPGFIPPSDKITVANIGCGTQGLREMGSMLENPHIQVVSLCDPNKFSTDYLDWSPHGIRNGIRKTLGDQNWGANFTGIPGGRDIGKEYIDKYYAKNKASGKYKGCTSYEDFPGFTRSRRGRRRHQNHDPGSPACNHRYCGHEERQTRNHPQTHRQSNGRGKKDDRNGKTK